MERRPWRSDEKARSDIARVARQPDGASVDRSTAWRQGAAALLGQRLPGMAGGVLAAARGHAVALVYHRVRPEPARDYEVVPCVPVAQFRTHVSALRAVGDIVTVDHLLSGGLSRRPRIALTFDDDYATHFRHVLPVLRELEVPATFFLSGRSLHGLGPYWWEILEARIRADGAQRVARALEVGSAEPAAIAAACEEDRERQALLEVDAASAPDQLRADEISALAGAGMTIGFHTVEHAVLPLLSPADRRRALTAGRDRLQHLTGQRLAVFAYPHGRADAVTAADARAAAYRAAWTGTGSAVSGRSDPWRLSRWEAGAIDSRTLRARALARLLRPVPAHG